MFVPFSNSLMLDNQTVLQASAIYSLRKLVSGAKYAIRVRRSNDNDETDIGFIGSDLDTVSLLVFAGANSVFIPKWYDQSINGNHALQTTASNQPRIVNTGTIDTDGNRACIQAILANDTCFSVTDSDSLDFTTNTTMNVIYNPNSNGETSGRIVDKGNGLIANVSIPQLSFSSILSNVAYVTQSAMNLHTVTCNSIANQTKFYSNGDLNATTTRPELTVNSSPMIILNRFDLARQYDGKISELIFFKKTLSDSERQRLEYNQSMYYNIPLA